MKGDSNYLPNYWKPFIDNSQIISKEKEDALALRIQAGDREAIDPLVEANYRLVPFVVNSFKHLACPAIEYEDMIQIGNIALIEAAKRFDPTRGSKFSTFGVSYVSGQLKREIGKLRRLVRVPEVNICLSLKIVKIKEKYHKMFDRDPTVDEIVLETNQPISRVKKVLCLDQKIVNLDDKFVVKSGDESETRAEKDLSGLLKYSIDQELSYQVGFNLKIASALRQLSKRERFVIEKLFAVGSCQEGDRHTLEEVGEMIGLSRCMIMNIRNASLKKMKDYLSKNAV